MSQQQSFHLWKEAFRPKPIYRDEFKNMHLGCLHEASRNQPTEQLSVIQYQHQDFILCESKGRPKDVASLALPCPDTDSIWLCLQLQGSTVFTSGTRTASDTLRSFSARDEETLLTLSAEKHWALFLGITAATKEQLLSELPLFRDHFSTLHNDILPALPISHIERQALETFSKNTFGPFSTILHIGHLFLKLYDSYLQRLNVQLSRPTEDSNIQLYHRAMAYIRENYLDNVLNRETMADALHCSVRSLNRAFEGKNLSLNATILTIRLHKAREMLTRKPNLSIEQIALSLHFFDVSHFTAHYKKQFHRTPRQERKMQLSDNSRC